MQGLRLLGITATPEDVLALLHRHHYTLPTITAPTLCRLLLTEPSRNQSGPLATKRGAFTCGDSAAGRRDCKVVYKPCKTPVYTPSGWAEPGCGDAVIARSSEVPDARLALEFVYGFDGHSNTSASLFYNCERQVRYDGVSWGVRACKLLSCMQARFAVAQRSVGRCGNPVHMSAQLRADAVLAAWRAGPRPRMDAPRLEIHSSEQGHCSLRSKLRHCCRLFITLLESR